MDCHCHCCHSVESRRSSQALFEHNKAHRLGTKSQKTGDGFKRHSQRFACYAILFDVVGLIVFGSVGWLGVYVM